MTNVIDPNSKRPKDAPDARHVMAVDASGIWCEYSCSYTDHKGVEMCFTIWANGIEDAERRVMAMRESAKIDGQLYTTIDA